MITGTGGKDKTAVMGILERGGEVRTVVVGSRRKAVLQTEVKKHVEAGAALYTDALLSYDGLAGEYAHQVIDHATQYVDGRVQRLRAVPISPSAGRLKSAVLKAGPPLRGSLLIFRLPGRTFGVSTPLLLMPLGIVPSKEVSLLLKSVTGKPVLNRVIPETTQPLVIRS